MSCYPEIRIKDIEIEERPQERLERLGSEALSDTELLAMILRTGTKGSNVINMARQLLNHAGSLQNLLQFSLEDFTQISGIGKIKGLQLISLMELAKRVLLPRDKKPLLNTPKKVFDLLKKHTASLGIEKVWALCLNRKNYLIKMSEITSGIATSSLIHPREIFRESIRTGSTAIIVVHNHPSGDPSPSKADLLAAKKLLKSSKIVGVDLIDFIILGDPRHDPMELGYCSFRDRCLIG